MSIQTTKFAVRRPYRQTRVDTNKGETTEESNNITIEDKFATFDLALQYAKEKKRDGYSNVRIVAITEAVIETEIMSL